MNLCHLFILGHIYLLCTYKSFKYIQTYSKANFKIVLYSLVALSRLSLVSQEYKLPEFLQYFYVNNST